MQLELGKNGEEIILSVGEYLDRLNLALGVEAGFVQGEVTEFKESHKWVSFTLKDKDVAAVLKCVCAIYTFRRMGVALEDGMAVKVYGTPRVSKGWGSLGLWVESIEPVGEGSLKKAYELLVKKLTAEGLFARKRGLPEFISRIGVISSRDGVVLQDLRKNLAKLGMSIKFVHTQVEGAGAVPGILRALDYFHQSTSDFDVLVVIRGGGSLESLQAFNNEEVARALFSLPIPVIAGIGHDVDVPIAALVADAEGSTPTAVAHIINDTWSALVVGLPQLERDLERGMQNLISGIKQKVALLEQKMFSYFTRIFRSFDQMLARLSRGTNAIGVRLKLIREQIGRAEGLFALADPMRHLRLGYSITMVGGKVVKKRGDVNMGDTLETRFSDGSIETKVTKK